MFPVEFIVPSVPLLGPDSGTMVKLSGSLSTSDPDSVIVTAVSSGVDTVLLSAVGASLTGVTVMDTVAAVLLAGPSFAMYWNVLFPLKLAFGVY